MKITLSGILILKILVFIYHQFKQLFTIIQLCFYHIIYFTYKFVSMFASPGNHSFQLIYLLYFIYTLFILRPPIYIHITHLTSFIHSQCHTSFKTLSNNFVFLYILINRIHIILYHQGIKSNYLFKCL